VVYVAGTIHALLEAEDVVFGASRLGVSFVSHERQTTSRRNMLVEDYLRPAAAKAGVLSSHRDEQPRLVEDDPLRFGFHNLRHILASFLVRMRTDPKTVQTLLRHSDVKLTLQFYNHAASQDRLAAAGEMRIVILGHAADQSGAKYLFGATSINPDWRNNAHDGFHHNKDGSASYSAFTDFLGHKDLGEKTTLFLIDGLYGNDNVDGPIFRISLMPITTCANLLWPATHIRRRCMILNAMASDAAASVYMSINEHWNNGTDKKYSRNLGKEHGIELFLVS
jgi:hypothetical protein